jgi:tetratricopeptide (TPR) repeat protein
VKKPLIMVVCALFAVSAFAAEDWRGNNRLQGTIIDKSTGKGVAGAKVKLRKGTSGPDATTDANGKWAVLGLAPGSWNIDVEASGYETKQGNVGMAEGQRIPPLKIEIEPMAAPVAATPEAAAVEEVKIGGVAVTPEIAAAVETGNKLVGEQKYKEAVVEYEKAYPSLSANTGLKLALARAYYGSGELKKAIVLMEEAYKADPQTQTGVLLANMYVEDGQTDKAKEIIEKIPAGSITDPMIYVNMGIAAMNKKQPAVSIGYFTKAIELDPKRYEGYYYRGLASIQMNKAKDAKPDLQKVLELAPADSPDLKDAKEYLKSIK